MDATRGADPEGPKAVVLVVDDDEGIRDNLAELLSLEDYRVLTAANAEEAMERFESENVDLLLTDFQMPGANGVELIEAVRRIRPEIPALLITAYPYVYEQIDPARRVRVGLLRKPFAADEVITLVGQMLAK